MSSFKHVALLSTVYLLTFISLCKSEGSYPEDTYINALQTSHLSDSDSSSDFGGYNYSPAVNNQYLPPTTPVPVYGPPASVYGPPAPVYGPPQPTFYKPMPFPLHPRDHFSLLEKLKTKLKGMFKEDMSMDEDSAESKQVETEKDVLEKRIEEVYDFAIKAFNKFQKDVQY